MDRHEPHDHSTTPIGGMVHEPRRGSADRLASPPGIAAMEPSRDGNRGRNRKPRWLQIARTNHGWFVIGIDPDDEYGLNFQTIGGPKDTREAARDYLREVSSWDFHDEQDVTPSGEVNLTFQVRLYRKVAVWQLHVIEVEATDERDAERRAIMVVEDDDFDEEQWETVMCDRTHSVLIRPHTVWNEPLPRV